MRDDIGIYHLLSLCGEGASGKVFVAENRLTGARYALKLLDTGALGEAELSALMAFRACRHCALIEILHVDRTETGQLYYTMPLADDLSEKGGYLADTLANRIRKKGKLPEAETRALIEPLVKALNILHRNNLLHRDVKPDNILFIAGKPVLGDIGLLTDAASPQIAGTRGFFRASAKGGARRKDDDFYALIITLYCALTGFAPEEFPSVPEAPSPLLADLLRIGGKAEITGDDFAALGRPPEKRLFPILIAAAIVIAALAIAGILIGRRSLPAPSPTHRAENAPVKEAMTPLEKIEPPQRFFAADEWEEDLRFVKRTAGVVLFQSYGEMASRISEGDLFFGDLNFQAEAPLPVEFRSGKAPRSRKLFHRTEIAELFTQAADYQPGELLQLRALYLADEIDVRALYYPLLQTECEIRLEADARLRTGGSLTHLRRLFRRREALLMQSRLKR